jgi:hypothetical protein
MNRTAQHSTDANYCGITLHYIAGVGWGVYLEVDSRAISACCKRLVSNALEAFLVFVVFGLLAWVLAVFSQAAVCIDIGEVRVGYSTVPAYPERWDLLMHIGVLVIDSRSTLE